MYVDTFNLKGEKIPIRDSETRKIVDQLGNIISGTVGNSGLPIYLEDSEFKPCDSTLNVDITGKAQSAVTADSATRADTADSATHADTADSATHADTADSATHADTADSATRADTADSATRADTADSATHADTADSATHAGTADSATHADTADSATRADTADSATRADTADSATRADTANSATHAGTADSATEASKLAVSAGSSSKPVYFSGGKPVQCDSTLAVDISGNADNATHANNSDNALYAINSGSATHADSADSATHANSAITATAATTAEKLNVSAGGNTRPVYFSNGKPVQCGQTLDVDVTGKSASADKVTLNSVLSAPFIRIPVDTSNGKIYMLTGSTALNVNISTVYGNAFIGDFTIPIPLGVRLPNGYYSVQVTCQANLRVVIPSLHVATGLANIVGWVESSIKGQVDVLFYVFIMGY